MFSAVDPMKTIIYVSSNIISASNVDFLFNKGLRRRIPIFFLVRFMLIALVMVVRETVALNSSRASMSIAIHGRISIGIEDGSLMQAGRKADN